MGLPAITPEIDSRSRPAGFRGLLSARELLVQVFYNRRLIVACILGGLALGAAAAVLSPPRYTAETLLLVRVGAAEQAQDGLAGPRPYVGGEAIERALQSEVRIVRSEPILREALQTMRRDRPAPGLRGALAGALPPSADARAATRFSRDLKVGIEPGSNVIRIAFTSPDRARALAAVEAVSRAYVARRGDLYLNGARTRQNRQVAHYAEALAATETDIQQVRLDYDVIDVAKDVSLASERLDDLVRRVALARERHGVVGAELAATTRTLAATPERVLDSQERTNAVPNDEARNTLLRLRQERAHVAAQYAADWPGLIELDAKIAAAQTQIAENNLDIRSSDRTTRNPVVGELASRRASLVIERDALGRQSAELDAQIATTRERIQRLREADMRLHDLERSREASETIYRALLVGRAGSSLEDQAVDDHSTTLRVVQPPSAPSRGRSLQPLLVLAGGLAGLAFAVVGATAATVLRQTFITPSEAEDALDLPAIMTVDWAESEWRTAAGAAAADRLAAALADGRIDGRPATVLQVVGEDPAAKARLALALARAMARREVRPVLLIDFDVADRYARGAPSEAIRRLPMRAGHLDVAPLAEPGLWTAIAPYSSAVGDPRRPPQDLVATLALLREAFARVVIVAESAPDSPTSRRLHAAIDASLLVVAAEATRAPVAARLRETVLAAGGDVIGFVFTHRRRHIPEAIYRWL